MTKSKKDKKTTPNLKPKTGLLAYIRQLIKSNIRKSIIIFICTILCVAGFVLYLNRTFSSVILTLTSQNIRKDMTEARSTLVPSFNAEREQRVNALHQAGVINSAPTHSAQVDSCHLVAVTKNIYTTVDWTQNCYMTYSDVYETTLAKEEILAGLTSSELVTEIFGEPQKYNAGIGGRCDSLYYDSKHTPSIVFVDWSRGQNTSCKLYDPSKGASGISGKSATNLVRSYELSDINPEKSYIYIHKTSEYFSKHLGCGKKDLFGCNEPIDQPVTDFEAK